MVGHGQINLHQLKDRTNKPFRSPIGPMKHFLDRQHDLERWITIIKLAAALFFPGIKPSLRKVF